jgi:hypothetical protein
MAKTPPMPMPGDARADDAASLAVMAVAPSSRVLALGLRDPAVVDALVARHCTVWAIARDESDARALKPRCEEVVVGDAADLDVAATFASVVFDVVLALGVIDETPRPDAVLTAIASCLPARARAIVSVANATHIDARLAALRPPVADGETLPLFGLADYKPPARFDRAGLEAVLQQAGLSTVELLRVVQPSQSATFQGPGTTVDPGVPPEVIAWLAADPEATTVELVAVATAGEDHPSATSLAEHLQGRINHLEIVLADSRNQLAQMEFALQARQAETDALRDALDQAEAREAQAPSRAREMEDILRQRMGELDSLDHALKVLQADLALKDAYVVELRTACQQAEKAANAADVEAAQLRVTLAAVETSRDAYRSEVTRLRHFEDELAEVKARAGYRLLERASEWMKSVPGLMAGAKWLARRVAPRP